MSNDDIQSVIRDVATGLKLYPELDWATAECNGRYVIAQGEVRSCTVDVLALACKARAELSKSLVDIRLDFSACMDGVIRLRLKEGPVWHTLRWERCDPSNALEVAQATLLLAAYYVRNHGIWAVQANKH